MMKFQPARLMAIAAVGLCICAAPAMAQILKKEPVLTKEPGIDQLPCGQKVFVENNTCPPDQILQVTGSCLKTAPTIDMLQTPRGTQYNCIKRKRD
jgi:hypothetical protein